MSDGERGGDQGTGELGAAASFGRPARRGGSPAGVDLSPGP